MRGTVLTNLIGSAQQKRGIGRGACLSSTGAVCRRLALAPKCPPLAGEISAHNYGAEHSDTDSSPDQHLVPLAYCVCLVRHELPSLSRMGRAVRSMSDHTKV
jgi:hypothetical protein